MLYELSCGFHCFKCRIGISINKNAISEDYKATMNECYMCMYVSKSLDNSFALNVVLLHQDYTNFVVYHYKYYFKDFLYSNYTVICKPRSRNQSNFIS